MASIRGSIECLSASACIHALIVRLYGWMDGWMDATTDGGRWDVISNPSTRAPYSLGLTQSTNQSVPRSSPRPASIGWSLFLVVLVSASRFAFPAWEFL
jgi:hypothetical protein